MRSPIYEATKAGLQRDLSKQRQIIKHLKGRRDELEQSSRTHKALYEKYKDEDLEALIALRAIDASGGCTEAERDLIVGNKELQAEIDRIRAGVSKNRCPSVPPRITSDHRPSDEVVSDLNERIDVLRRALAEEVK